MTEAGTPLKCPYCETALLVSGEKRLFTCESCGEHLNLDSQFAYLRGKQAFLEGRNIFADFSPKRKPQRYDEAERQGLDLFIESYSALQLAFQAELSETQRQEGIEMMAGMANIFMQKGMVSPFEANYWTMLMVEVTAQGDLDQIKEKHAQARRGIRSVLLKARWNTRKKQLKKKLVEVEQKIQTLERNIAFVEKPHVRARKQPPK